MMFFTAGIFLSPCEVGAVSSELYLYILEFDNLKSDPSVGWLSQGFVDMLDQNFSDVFGITVHDKEKLEAILQDKSILLRQKTGTNNILIMGNFVRDLNQITVNIQGINIANWEELGRTNVIGRMDAIADLSNSLAENIGILLTGYYPKPPPMREEAEAVKTAEFQEYTKELNVSMSSALEDLESAMDVYIGTRGVPEEPTEPGNKFTREFTFTESGVFEKPSFEDVSLLGSIISIISNNPYQVEIQKPGIELLDKKSKKILLTLPVKYFLRKNLINDLLTSVPYTAIREDGSLTTLEFSRKKYALTPDLQERISLGEYRIVPVIQIFNITGQIKTVIVDTGDPSWYSRSSDKVQFFAEKIFSPLIVFTVSGMSLQVTMESVDIDAKYQIELLLNEVANYSKVTVEFIPEHKLTDFLGKIL